MSSSGSKSTTATRTREVAAGESDCRHFLKEADNGLHVSLGKVCKHRFNSNLSTYAEASIHLFRLDACHLRNLTAIDVSKSLTGH
jgi:hypothetical protein